jgi:pimeloyl-ACP methyl ester carboxylesterase
VPDCFLRLENAFMSVELNHRISGEGNPVILLHGLFGSLDNLGVIARGLRVAGRFTVWTCETMASLLMSTP